MPADAPLAASPFVQFQDWMADAEKSEPNDPNAMIVGTATADGRPSLRAILLKGVDERGFVFYTNKESRKGGELAANPQASLLFHWKSLQPPDPDRGRGRERHRRGGGRLLPVAPADFAVGGLGVAAVASVGEANNFGRAACGDGGALPR